MKYTFEKTNEEHLAHFGIKGMKWRKRKKKSNNKIIKEQTIEEKIIKENIIPEKKIEEQFIYENKSSKKNKKKSRLEFLLDKIKRK